MYYPFYVDPDTLQVSLEPDEKFSHEVLPYLSDGAEGRWRWGKDSAVTRISELTARPVGAEKRLDIFQIDFAGDENGNKRIKPKSVWMGTEFANEAGTLQTKLLFGKALFDNPKPLGLIDYLIEQSCHDGIILDFFAGSATTGHAVFANNIAKKRVNRFILVQLPEEIDSKSEAAKQGYRTISQLSIERLKRAAEAVKEQGETVSADLGFKVMKLNGSNINAWNPDRTDLEETLLSHKDHLVEGRSEHDVLYELLLKRGIELTAPIEEKQAAGKTIYSIGYGVLFACLDTSFAKGDVDAVAGAILAWHKELEPETDTHVFFRDSAFADDIAKTNMAAILEQNGIRHVRSL